MANLTISKVKVAIQAKTERTFVGSWKVSGSYASTKHECKFTCDWGYYAGGKWFEGSSGTTTYPYTTSTYSSPENATQVRFRVKGSYKSGDKTKETKYSSWVKADIKKSTDYGFLVGVRKQDGGKNDTNNKPVISFDPSGKYPLVVYCYPTRSKEAFDNSWLASYEVRWDFWNGYFWESGQASTPQTKYQHTVEYDGTIPSTTTKIRATVIPTSGNAGVVAKDQSVIKEVKRSSRTVTALNIARQTKTDRGVIASWGIGSVNGITGFSYVFQAWDGQYWSNESTGTVDISSVSSAANAKDKRWLAAYTVPESATKVRVRVLPVAGDNDGYVESWSNWVEHSWSVGSRETGDVTLSILPGTDRTVVAQWTLPDKSNVASFEYRWSYYVFDSDILFVDSTGNVDVDAPWNCKYDAGVNVRQVLFEVKPIPKYESAFVGSYCAPKSMSFEIPELGVGNLILTWPYQERTEREMVATWSISDDTNVENYECSWRYYIHYDELGDVMMDGGTSTTKTKSFTFTAPAKAQLVELMVRPVPKKETDFSGQWSDYVDYQFVIDTRSAYIEDFHILEDTERTMLLTWDINDESHVNDYTWETRIFRDENWFEGDTQTVIYKAAEFDAPSRIDVIEARVKPNDDSGNELYFKGEWSDWVAYNFTKTIRTVENITLQLQRGSTRTVVATWEIENYEQVSGYDYKWRYYIDGIWYDGNEGTASDETLVCTYDAPESAELVEVKIRPVPLYERSFEPEWSDYEMFAVPGATVPDIPSVPNITVDKYNLMAQLDNYDTRAYEIEFEVVNETENWDSGTVEILLNRATYICVVEPGHTYRARARAINEDGEWSEWSEYSTEAAAFPDTIANPPEVRALTATSVELTWEEVPGVTSYTIEYTTKSRYFDAAPDQVKNVTIEAGTRAEIIGLDSGETWFFRIKSVNSQGESEWCEPVSVTIGVTPDPPTTWSSTAAARNDRDVYLYWVHNAEDASLETEATLELTINGESEEIVIPKDEWDTGTSNYKIDANTFNAGAVIKWRVKTKGVLPDYGEYSTTRQINIYAPPTLSAVIGTGSGWNWDPFNFNEDNIYEASGTRILLSNDTLTAFPAMVFLTAGPSTQTPIAYTISIIANEAYEDELDDGRITRVAQGAEVFSKVLYSSKNDLMFMLTPGDVNLEDGISYTLKATVAMDSGLSASSEYRFVVDWEEADDVSIDATLVYDKEASVMYIRPEVTNYAAGLRTDMTLSIYRIDYDGGFTEIIKEVQNNEFKTFTDPHPSLNYARYRIAARSSSTGNIYFYDLPAYEVHDPVILIQWDEQVTTYTKEDPDEIEDTLWRGSMLRLPYNIDESDSNTLDVEMVNYIGRKHPVSYYGTHVGQTASWKTDIPKSDIETIAALRRLAVWPGDAYVRSPSGAGYWAYVQVTLDINHLDVIVPVNLSITRVDGGA